MKLKPYQTIALLAAMLVVSLLCPYAAALTTSQKLEDLTITAYAPAWTWQKQNINILVVVENGGGAARDVSLAILLPPGQEDHFTYEGGQDTILTVPAGGRVRHAFTNITARDGVPRQEYIFTLTVQAAGASLAIPYPVRTVRGAAVNPGKWAAFLPAGVAAAWCLVFLVVLARYAAPGAWRRPGEPMREPEDVDAWITNRP